jgi:gluconolactonase
VAADGSVGPWRRFATLGPGGVADGLKVAADGSVWIADAHGGRVAVFEADGRHRRDLAVPLPMVTSLCFGGADLRDLYVVTGSRGGPRENCGSIFRIRADVPGLPLAPARVKVPGNGPA